MSEVGSKQLHSVRFARSSIPFYDVHQMDPPLGARLHSYRATLKVVTKLQADHLLPVGHDSPPLHSSLICLGLGRGKLTKSSQVIRFALAMQPIEPGAGIKA